MICQVIENKIEAGCDEAGRGCLSGPVFAAAVIWDRNIDSHIINDSKKLSEKQRNELRIFIEENAIAWSVAYVKSEKIDEINILSASILAMHLALDNLKVKPEHIAVDGNRFKPYSDIPYECVVKGDAKYTNIAAASILAKTYRDEFMCKIHNEFPQYNWKKNKGYPTAEHRNAIREFGLTPYHRKSFRQLPEQIEIKF